jgi:hypothetical protein
VHRTFPRPRRPLPLDPGEVLASVLTGTAGPPLVLPVPLGRSGGTGRWLGVSGPSARDVSPCGGPESESVAGGRSHRAGCLCRRLAGASAAGAGSDIKLPVRPCCGCELAHVSGLACRESSESLAARGRQSCRGRGPASSGTQVSVRVMARCQWLTDPVWAC